MKRAILPTGLLCLSLLAACSRDEATPSNRPSFRANALAHGKSMLPTFAEVEFVEVELCRFGDLRANDTVIFWHDGAKRFVHHRLVERDATGRWVSRGDNNALNDAGHITADEFVGRTHKIGPQ
jgi:hypothetical protein